MNYKWLLLPILCITGMVNFLVIMRQELQFSHIISNDVVADWLTKVVTDARSDKKNQDDKPMPATAVYSSSYLKVACEQDR